MDNPPEGSRLRRGTGDFFGELLVNIGLGAAALVLVLAGRGLDWLVQAHPVIGTGVVVSMMALAVYGVWCTARWRPGLLLDRFRSSEDDGVRPGRVAMVAMGWVQVLVAAAVLYLLAVWAWGRP